MNVLHAIRQHRPAMFLVLGIAQAGAMTIPMLAAAQAAVPPTFEFQQGPLPLGEALLLIARKAGVHVVFDPEFVRPYQSAPVRGKLSTEDAFKEALRGSELTLKRTPNGSYTVAAAAPKQAPPEQGPAAEGAAPVLADIVVRAQRLEKGYAADSTRAATRTETHLLELAQSVSTVTRELMDDQQATNVMDALRNVSGVIQDNVATGPQPTISVRGFTVENGMSDGMMTSGTMALYTPTIGLERLEVLKGPEGIIGGTAAKFGGVVNLVAKKPQATPVREMQYSINSKGTTQLGLDVTGALNESKSLTGRVVASAEKEGDNDLGWDGGKNFYLAPSVAWKDAKTSVLVGAELQNIRRPYGNYVYFTGTTMGKDYSTIWHAKDDAIDLKRRRIHFDFSRDLGNAWKFGLRGQYIEETSDSKYWQQVGLSLPQAATPMILRATGGELNYLSRTAQMDISKRVDFGPTEHRLMFGLDFFKANTYQSLDYFYDSQVSQTRLSGTSGVLPSVESLANSARQFDMRSSYIERGLFLQDQITFGDNLHASLAMRHVTYQPENSDRSQPISETLPSVGLVYEYMPGASVYASYSKGVSFPLSLPTRDGSALPPVYATQKEVGAKNTFFDERLVLTTALFDIKKTNVPTADIDDPSFYHADSGSRRRGIEIELNGRVTPAWNVSMAYTLYRKATVDSGGPRVSYVPRQQFNLWTQYRFGEGALRGLTLGGGLTARSEVIREETGSQITQINPGNARLDLAATYEFANYSFRLGVRNVTNRKLFTTGSTLRYAELEPSRTVTLSGSLRF